MGTWGFVASLARPGGNVTGSTAFDPGLEGKRLGLLREAVPGARRMAFLFFPHKRGRSELKRTETAARTLGVKIQRLPVRSLGDIEGAFQAMAKERPEALIIPSAPITNHNRKRVAELVIARKLPAICAYPKIARIGCILAYVPDRTLSPIQAKIDVELGNALIFFRAVT